MAVMGHLTNGRLSLTMCDFMLVFSSDLGSKWNRCRVVSR